MVGFTFMNADDLNNSISLSFVSISVGFYIFGKVKDGGYEIILWN